jgi:hypothetical protein
VQLEREDAHISRAHSVLFALFRKGSMGEP